MTELVFRWCVSLARVCEPQKANTVRRVATSGNHVERVILDNFSKIGTFKTSTVVAVLAYRIGMELLLEQGSSVLVRVSNKDGNALDSPGAFFEPLRL